MALPVNPKQFIKLYRQFMNWQWYTDLNTKALFIHCLLRANWKAGEWKGIHYSVGEFITTLPTLSKETGLSVQQARSALTRLESTGEITSRLTDTVTGKKLSKCRIIAIKNWSKYQGSTGKSTGKSTGNSAGNQQATNRQTNSSIRNINRTLEDIEKDSKTVVSEQQAEEPFPVEKYGFDPWECMTPEQGEIYAEWRRQHGYL